jgi:hypothetical protein
MVDSLGFPRVRNVNARAVLHPGALPRIRLDRRAHAFLVKLQSPLASWASASSAMLIIAGTDATVHDGSPRDTSNHELDSVPKIPFLKVLVCIDVER